MRRSKYFSGIMAGLAALVAVASLGPAVAVADDPAQACSVSVTSENASTVADACTSMLAAENQPAETRLAAYLHRGQARYAGRDFSGATRDFDAAMQIDPASRTAVGYRAYAFVALGRVRRAQRELLPLMTGAPEGDAFSFSAVVRELATTAEPHRNGELALRLIEESEPIALDDPTVLEAVAAAYATDRQFDTAVRAQYEALKLAEASGEADVAGYRTRFELYKAKQSLVCPGMQGCW